MDPRLKIPGYTLQSTLGQGGMATVYLAIQDSLDRPVALKVMSAALASDPMFCERFLKEGKIIAQLSSHHDIVTIYDINCVGANYYMAMEYVPGANLKQRIEQNEHLDDPLTVIMQVASALGYAHKRGFIHRDVKPANILFREDGSAVLTDFGIAKSLSSNTQLTTVGYTVGTPEYMSPEQAVGQPMDSRSDLYSLGVVLYEMLARQKPYVGEDAFATALMHVNSPVPRLPDRFTSYQVIIDRLLAKDPNDRFASARALIEFVNRMNGHSRGAAPTVHAFESGSTRAMGDGTRAYAEPENKRAGGSGARILGVGAALLAIAGIGGYLYLHNPDTVVISDNAVEDKLRDERPEPLPPQALLPKQRERVKRLLRVADAHVAYGRLKEPPGSNAFEAYQLILEIDPDNPRAKAGLREIETRLEQEQR